MKNSIALILLGLALSLSSTAFADDHSTLRVVTVATDDAAAYIKQLKQGKQLIAKVSPDMQMRVWQATFAGDAAGTVSVGIEHPGSLSAFANSWEKVQADSAVSKWLAGLSGMREIVSDSLYNEVPL